MWAICGKENNERSSVTGTTNSHVLAKCEVAFISDSITNNSTCTITALKINLSPECN